MTTTQFFSPSKSYFDHEKLDVYQVAMEFITLVDEIVDRLPRGRAYLSDQLLRAATSRALNIAEGAGEYSGNEKGRFYRMARRSATECAAIMDICCHLKLVGELEYTKGREFLNRVVAMLTRLGQGFSSN